MRRWLAILLLVFMPLQSFWAAAANYCGHESGVAVEHIGHHDHAGHEHGVTPATPDSQDEPEGTEPGLSDLGCGHSHGCCVGLLVVACVFAPQLHTGTPPALSAASGAEYVPTQPERPQWAPLA